MPRHQPQFDDLLDVPATVSARLVPNVHPIITNVPYRIAIVGEAPGTDEVAQGIPFVGASGRELDKYLSKVGILRDACFIGNVCQQQPPGNKLAYFSWDGPEIQNGLAQLKHDLSIFSPFLVWCLGGTALHAFKLGIHNAPSKRKTKDGPTFAFDHSIGDWRGSLFIGHLDSPLPGVKCVASYHPAAALRNFEWMPTILLDLLFKVKKQAEFPELRLPLRELKVNLSLDELLTELDKIKLDKPLISIDIEGGIGTLSCISVASSPSTAFIIPFTKADNTSFWNVDDECRIWKSLASVLADGSIPKCLQNSLYDRFVLQYSYGAVMRGVTDDTMLKWWELYCEMPKSLGFQASVLTEEPYWKEERIQAEQKL